MFIKSLKAGLCLVAFIILAACTNASVEQDLVPQPIATQPTAIDGAQQTAGTIPSQPTNPTALSPQVPLTPAQNVAEAQLQQAAGLVEATGPSTQQPVATQPTITQPITPKAPAQVASLDTSKALTFLPFEGAPNTKVASFKKFLNSSGQSKGLAILPATRTGAKYKVKGYFSAFNDGKGTLLVYVWDVTDNTGKRLHRINGREHTGISKSDPWQAISDKEIERVASSTTAKLKNWIDKR